VKREGRKNCRPHQPLSRITHHASRITHHASRITFHVSRIMFKIGVISDTHNHLDPRISHLFAGVDHILHGGDIGLPAIILALEQIAPVTAVGGNTDDPGFRYPQAELVALAGRKYFMQHIVNPHSLADALKARIARERPDVVVFGHTHKPFAETIGGTRFFNPGYAGKARFDLERSVAILHCGEKGIRAEYLKL
jgi:putative phosphoesterase